MSLVTTVVIPKSLDRKVLIAMITSTRFLSKVRNNFKAEYLSTDYARTVSSWCIDYFEKYQRAPESDIRTIFEQAKVDNPRRKSEYEVIENFLSSISIESDKASLNIDYLLDTVKECWAKENYRILAENLQSSRTADEASSLLKDFETIQTTSKEPTQILDDKSIVDELFKEEEEALITFSGDLGELVGPWMTRDQLICIIAPAKGGKTAALAEIASRGISARRSIAFFQCGDLSSKQFYARIFSNLAGKPSSSRFSKSKIIPCVDCYHHCKGDCSIVRSNPVVSEISQEMSDEDAVDFSPCSKGRRCNDFTPFIAKKQSGERECLQPDDVLSCQRRLKEYLQPAQFMSMVVPNSTITVADIDSCLKSWRDEYGFIPDIILIDYADIMAPEKGSGSEERDRQNLRWKKLRRLSQEWHCLVVAPTQSNRDGFDKELLNAQNLSEDVRKLAHATGVLAIHQTAAERHQGISRVSWILGRDGQPDNSVQVIVCNDMAVGRWAVQSCYRYPGYDAKKHKLKREEVE